jgi:hypothetical protein
MIALSSDGLLDEVFLNRKTNVRSHSTYETGVTLGANAVG